MVSRYPLLYWLSLIHSPLAHMTGLLLLAVLLGGLVGWERERHTIPAGMRTHILVCLGATLMTLVSNSSSSGGARIAAQIVTGIGFLGAGTILRAGNGDAVRGLTTAASLWAIAGVGIAIGYGGLYAQTAAVTTVIILLVLTLFNRFQRVLVRHRTRHRLSILFTQQGDFLATLGQILIEIRRCAIQVSNLSTDQIGEGHLVHMELQFYHGTHHTEIEPILTQTKGVLYYDWED